MQKILRKRVFRDLKENFFRYLALGLLIVLGMYIIVSIVAAAETIMTGTKKLAEESLCEDGQFGVFVPLSEAEEQELTDIGITLEKMFYLDFAKEDDSTLRVYQNREQINQLVLDEGSLADKEGEAVLEKRYAEEHDLQVGDNISFAGYEFQIVGIGSVPDYEAPYREFSDSAVDSEAFGLLFVDKASYEMLKASGKSEQSESLYYSYLLNEKMTNDELKDILKSFEFSAEELENGLEEYFEINLNNLTTFLKAEDNPRIGAAASDQVINKLCGLVAGVIVMILFAYVISVFVIHGIEKECSVIGALYALGVKRKDLIFHYLMLPVVVIFLAGIVGTLLGFSEWGISGQMEECYRYFSLPQLAITYPTYLIVYSAVMPSIVAIVVNYFVIRRHLSRNVLSLLRNEQKENRISNINLGKMGFIARFQVRQMLRELRTGFTVVFGMFISLLIMMLGIDCYVMVTHLGEETNHDTRFEYMYTYKYPDEKVIEDGEEAFAKSLKREIYGYNLEVTLLGIHADNPYFDAEVEKGENKVVISSAVSQKYRLETGDEIVLKDEEAGRNYAFEVTDIVQYTSGLYVFMDIDSMRALMGEADNYYNVVFSDRELDIPSGRLYATTTRDEIVQASVVFVDMMMPMITMMCSVSAIIFCVVMYLMMKVMIDRAAFGISLIKIFGYRTGEIRKLYLNGNFYIIAIGAAISLPLAKKTMDMIYPYMVSNVACGMNLTFDWQLYVGIYLIIILLYLIINQMLVRRVKKIIPAEVLKNRE